MSFVWLYLLLYTILYRVHTEYLELHPCFITHMCMLVLIIYFQLETYTAVCIIIRACMYAGKACVQLSLYIQCKYI